MPRVSIIIPSYNHAKYIRESIQSILDQTYQDFEIVITDDGSKDDTVEKIRKFNDLRIKLFVFNENKGACAASNNCIANSSGEFVAMLSSDDIFLPDKLEKQVRFLDEHPEIGAVFGNAEIVDEDGKKFTDEAHPYFSIFQKKNRSRFEWLNRLFYKGNCLCHPSVLIRRECYEKVGVLDERLAQVPDLDFWIRLLMEYEIFVMPDNLIKFRVRAGELNASGIRPETQRRGQVEFKRVLRNFLKINSVEDFIKIFPVAKEFGIDSNDSHLLPFFLSKIALSEDHILRKELGIDILFDLLGDKMIAKELAEKFEFAYKDFIKITGKYDIYSLETLDRLRNPANKKCGFSPIEIVGKIKLIFVIGIRVYKKRGPIFIIKYLYKYFINNLKNIF